MNTTYSCAIITFDGHITMRPMTLLDIRIVLPYTTLERDCCLHLRDPYLCLYYNWSKKGRISEYNELASSLAKRSICGAAVLAFSDGRNFTAFDIIALGLASDTINIEEWRKEKVHWFDLFSFCSPLSKQPSFNLKISRSNGSNSTVSSTISSNSSEPK